MAPNFPALPGTYSFDKIEAAITGKTDLRGREYTLWQALASSIGIKLHSYDTDMLRWQAGRDAEEKIMEIRGNINRAARDYGRKGMDKGEFDDTVQREQEKLRNVAEGLRKKMN